jgi:2-keto-4-pentenoate hydratase/2-oxohepta-3-ene-1,7-dioic acid hydratase in catechol pathway
VGQVVLGPPVPEPRAVYGVGLNYRAHAAETGRDPGELPGIFTKFPTAVTGPFADVVLPRGRTMVDWEAELAVVFGDGGRYVAEEDASAHILGYLCAQDISERYVQRAAMNQFSMAKSYDTFCPLGPAVVTLDELADPDDLRVTCRVNGELRQDDRTSGLIVGVAALTSYISSVCPLRAGDVCLTGTPAGVGAATGTFLAEGDVIETEIEGLGTMRNRCVPET